MRTLASNQSHQFDLDAREFWNPSDCLLDRGGRYRLDLLAETEPWVDGWVASTPDRGWPWWGRPGDWISRGKARAPRLPMYVLVGAVERDPTSYFNALRPNTWTAPRGGPFELFAND